MSITLQKLKHKLQIFLNNNIWPFTVISDTKSKLDQAQHDRQIAVDDLMNFMQREVHNGEVMFHVVDGRRPKQLVIHTGVQVNDRPTSIGGHGHNEAEVIFLEPRIQYFAYMPFPNYMTRAEIANQYQEMLADHVGRAVSDYIIEQGIENVV